MADRKEYMEKYMKQYRNRSERKKYIKEFYQKNKKAILRDGKQYRQTASGIYSGIKGALKKRDELDKLKISRDDFIVWYNSQKKICFYCKRTAKKSALDYHFKNPPRLSIDRIDSKKGYEEDNIVLACMRCNMIKNNFFTKNEMLKIIEMFSYKFC